MQDYQTIKKQPGARWAISRATGSGYTIYLIENAPVSDVSLTEDQVIVRVLTHLNLENHLTVVEEYFPTNVKGRRCPTLELMRRWCESAYSNEVAPSSNESSVRV